MAKHISETQATQFLKKHQAAFSEHPYDYVDHGGTAESARQLGVDEHQVVKTLVMQDDRARPIIVLMHGDRTVSTKNLARQTVFLHLPRKMYLNSNQGIFHRSSFLIAMLSHHCWQYSQLRR